MAGSEHGDGTEQDTKKERGAGFPTISLPEAAEIVKQAGKYGKQHSMSAMAGYAGHKTDNSGPFRQKLASLKDWGFVTVSGKTVHLSPSAIGLAHPTSEAAEAELLRKAFRSCALFWNVYTDLAKGVILDAASIGSKAVASYDISVRAKEKFAASFIHSAVAVGLAESTNIGEVRLLSEDDSQANGLGHEFIQQDGQVQTDKIRPAGAQPAAARSGKPVISQVWECDGVALSFEVYSPYPLSAASFIEVGQAVKVLEGLWESLQPSAGEEGSEAAA